MSPGPGWKRVSTFLGEEFEVPAESIQRDARLVEDLGLDSLDLVDMVVEMEKALGRRISNEELKQIRTVGGAVDLLDGVKAAPAQA